MAPVTRNALIIDSAWRSGRCAECDGLVSWLRQTGFFREVLALEQDVDPASTVFIPDAVFIRLSGPVENQRSIDIWKSQWPEARTLLMICRRAGIGADQLLSSVSAVHDFLFCSGLESELKLRAGRLFEIRKVSAACSFPKTSSGRWRDLPLIGESPSFVAALDKTSHLARTAAAVLISGETGSGKELFARAIHYQGDRQSKPFIPVNCGALPDYLFENELFGHTKGAFTDASSAEKGLIAEAEGGTLFLDEVDALSPAAQIKLLRFLQNGEYRPLGSSRSVLANVRVVAATNANLQEKVALKQFREDLFYRLNVLTISVPALRERGTDALRLAEHFLDVFASRSDRERPSLSAAARQKLLDYTWPGNVRELEGVIQRAVLLNSGDTLHAADIELPEGHSRDRLARESLRRAKSLVIGDFERGYVANLLAEHNGNISQAAKAAGKDRRTLQRLVRKYSLNRESFKF